MVFIAIVVVLALGGGTAFVAESSVPGDALYVVKTEVNEEVRGMLAIGAEADAEWEAEIAVRRLEEAAKMESRGTLSAEVAADLRAEFHSHAEAALAAAKSIDSSGQGDVSIESDIRARLDAAIQANASIFSPRDSASGQATGKINVNTSDVDGDGVVEVQIGTRSEDSGSGTSGTGTGASGGIELKAGYDVKANTR